MVAGDLVAYRQSPTLVNQEVVGGAITNRRRGIVDRLAILQRREFDKRFSLHHIFGIGRTDAELPPDVGRTTSVQWRA